MAPQHHRQPHSFLETHPSRKTFSPYATNTTNISMHQNKPYNEPLKWEGEKKYFKKIFPSRYRGLSEYPDGINQTRAV